MRLQFLGTAAAEGYPGIFCDCPNCNQARLLGGRNLRYRSALLVNDDLLIDFGPDLMAAAQRFGRNLSQVTTALVTHAHSDHFLLENGHMRREPFTANLTIPTLRLFGPQEVAGAFLRLAPDAQAELEKMRMQVRAVHAFERWQVGEYTFQAFSAQHAVGALEALFYSVSDGRHAFLYASDTGPFPEPTWQALAGQSFDAIIMEETMGSGVYNQHMSIRDFLQTGERMRAMGLLRPDGRLPDGRRSEGRLIATHFSHTSNPSHPELEAIFNPHNVEVAYDGMEVNFA